MIAIIPARGGSKGLPGKNSKELLGKPLIAYTIEAALGSTAISEVIVSTDDQQIADVSIQYGASVPFLRPAELASDTSMAIDTYLYMIDVLEKQRNTIIESIAVFLPTCPLRNSADINAAYQLFKERNADSVISYTEEHHPLSWHKYLDEEQRFTDVLPSDLSNRQELKKTYFPNGSIFFFKTFLLKQRVYYSENSFAYVMPRNRSIDIDTMEDFEYAEFLMQRNQDHV